MAQAQWVFQNNGVAWVGGNDGDAQVHGSLANPLAGEGTFCRRYTTVGGGGNDMLATIAPSVDGGAYVGIPSTKSVSLRAWVRITNSTSNSAWISGKTGNYTNKYSGYHFGWGRRYVSPFAGNNTLFFAAVAPNGVTGVGGGQLLQFSDATAPNNIAAFLNPASVNNWLKLRMDILPLGATNDQIDLYVGTGPTGSEVWNLLHTVFINSGNSYWVPHSDLSSNEYGWGHGNSNSVGSPSYIDRFQIFVEDV